MSHMDDLDGLFCCSTPATVVGGIVFFAFAAIVLVWAAGADSESEKLCNAHGERYVDSRSGYTLCETDAGMVVRR